MKIIAHRGNLYGPNPETENTVEQAEKCFAMGFDVEVDVWHTDKGFFLGHDGPKNYVSHGWLINNEKRLYLHCKNQHAYAAACVGDLECFFHTVDQVVLTSKKSLWFFPGTEIEPTGALLISRIACMPELVSEWDIFNATHICTDYPVKYAEKYGTI